ncbi:MAG: hypothetical protein AB1451_11145 [Nitrospirota bacterium]
MSNNTARSIRFRNPTRHLLIAIAAATVVGMPSHPAYAAKYDISVPDGVLTQANFKDLSEQLGLVLAYHPLAPAEPLGLLGFDIGVEITASDIDENESFWTDVTSDIPSYLTLPKLHAQKGLPFGIDVGLVYSQVPSSNIGMWGAEVKWAILKGTLATPALALRGSYTTLFGVNNLDVSTYGADLSISKGFGPFTPYAGIGQVATNSSSDATAFGGGALQDESISATHGFIGAKLSFLMLSFVAEADFAAIPTYGLRLNLSF